MCKLHRINCPQIIARREFLITICKKRPSQRVWQRCRWQSWWCYSRPGRCQPQREQVLGIFIVIFERKTHSEKVIVLHRLHWKKPNEIQEKTEQRDVNPIFLLQLQQCIILITAIFSIYFSGGVNLLSKFQNEKNVEFLQFLRTIKISFWSNLGFFFLR